MGDAMRGTPSSGYPGACTVSKQRLLYLARYWCIADVLLRAAFAVMLLNHKDKLRKQSIGTGFALTFGAWLRKDGLEYGMKRACA